jgi:hypothetical protein
MVNQKYSHGTSLILTLIKQTSASHHHKLVQSTGPYVTLRNHYFFSLSFLPVFFLYFSIIFLIFYFPSFPILFLFLLLFYSSSYNKSRLDLMHVHLISDLLPSSLFWHWTASHGRRNAPSVSLVFLISFYIFSHTISLSSFRKQMWLSPESTDTDVTVCLSYCNAEVTDSGHWKTLIENREL